MLYEHPRILDSHGQKFCSIYPLTDFCGICRRQSLCEFNTVFRKSCIAFCAKPKEVDPSKLISLRINVSITLKYIINNSVLK